MSQHSVKICLCEQCRGVKARKRTKLKKRIKRYLNRKRRNGKDGGVTNWMWA
jgi:hypothetical protein